jgi:hypothetical protein
MTKKLETILGIDKKDEKVIPPSKAPSVPVINLQDKLEEFDKISAALPKVHGLGDMSDSEFDSLAAKAEQAYDDLMDLGMNVEARYSARMFEVAASMLKNAIDAKTAKLDKKLRMVDLQLKKMRLDQQNAKNDGDKIVEAEDGRAVILDRNELLKQILGKNPSK